MANWNRRVWDEAQDAVIRAAYGAKKRGANKALARRFGVSPRAISARAAVLGLPPLIAFTRNTQSEWREDEIALVRANLRASVRTIRAALAKKLGRYRSENAIRSLICRRRASGEWGDFESDLLDLDTLTAPAVCAGMGVGEWAVHRWIKHGYLRATQLRGDGVWAIRMKDLRAFLLAHPAIWDHRPADRWFLLDVLSFPRAVGRRDWEAGKGEKLAPGVESNGDDAAG